MKTLQEQILKKCIHFNGVMNDCCKAGIKYADVRVGRPFGFPCLQTGGTCASSKFPTEEEVKIKIAEITGFENKVLTAYINLKKHFEKTKEASGKIDCVCGGELIYAVASINGHMRARCSKCEISFIE